MNGWIDRWMDGWMDGWLYGWVDGLLDESTDKWINWWTYERTGEGMNGLMNGWKFIRRNLRLNFSSVGLYSFTSDPDKRWAALDHEMPMLSFEDHIPIVRGIQAALTPIVAFTLVEGIHVHETSLNRFQFVGTISFLMTSISLPLSESYAFSVIYPLPWISSLRMHKEPYQ